MNFLKPGTLDPENEKTLIARAKELIQDIDVTRKVKTQDRQDFLHVHNILCGTPYEKFSNCVSCVRRQVRELKKAVSHYEKEAKNGSEKQVSTKGAEPGKAKRTRRKKTDTVNG